ncbi:hypothetical protein L3X38_026267 [Prunus dulcis]|uniref:Uncharacterized protein n=1 Tax=Prunus dulcis TaxID=3755 RepID=A0AAD4W4F0_PRUDU|nr:hypothetical protein L3X38_026267 [Prunus dulcis]
MPWLRLVVPCLAMLCLGLGMPWTCVGMSWPWHALALHWHFVALACLGLDMLCLDLALVLLPIQFKPFRESEAIGSLACLALARVGMSCLGLGMPCLGLGIAPFKAFRESEAIGSLAWRGLGMPCLGHGLALALPHSRHFEKVRLLEAWHGVALACLALRWHVVPWPWHALPWPCVGMSCLGLVLPWPWHALPWPWHCPIQGISRK